MLAKNFLVPVIQLENPNCENTMPPNSEETVTFARQRTFKTLSNFKCGHEIVKIVNKMGWQKCIWFQSSNLKIEIERTRRHQVLRRQLHFSKCCVSTSHSNSKDGCEPTNVSARMHLVPVIQLKNRACL